MTIHELAEKLHSKMCHYNHTDGCSWFYETNPETMWDAWAHKRFLNKAEEMRKALPDMPSDEIAKVIDAL